MRHMMTTRKCNPLLNSESVLSLLRGTQNLQKHVKIFNYSYLLMLGEQDDIISQNVAIRWHNSTRDFEDKHMKIFAQMCHELHKDSQRD
jgi:esterase/lipase